MRYLLVPAALLLAGCALPGASGTGGFMAAAHPTQDSCAARGLTLDPTGKQCVVPPPAQAPATTGSLPAQNAATPQPSSPSASQSPAPAKGQQARPQQFQVQQIPTPPQPPPAQPQPEDKRASLTVPVEPDATLTPASPQSAEMAAEFAHFVRASGYRCDSISALAPRGGGFTLACNKSAFRYAIKNRDGGWSVAIE